MIEIGGKELWLRRELGAQASQLGLAPGDAVMVHAGLRAMGPMLNGPDALIGALRDVIGPEGTLLCYVDWDAAYDGLADADGRVPAALKADIPPFDPATSRANRAHGVLAEFIRTTPDARRSANPGASMVAVGARAAWFTADHPLDYGYGDGSPFAKLVAAGGKVLSIGAPLDTLSILHHAEHLAPIPGKRRRRIEVPLLRGTAVEWRMIEEFDTGDPVIDGLDPDYFAAIAEAFLAQGAAAGQGGRRGRIGHANATLFPARELVAFAVARLVAWCDREERA